MEGTPSNHVASPAPVGKKGEVKLGKRANRDDIIPQDVVYPPELGYDDGGASRKGSKVEKAPSSSKGPPSRSSKPQTSPLRRVIVLKLYRHVGTSHFVLYRKVVLSLEVKKMHSTIIGKWTLK